MYRLSVVEADAASRGSLVAYFARHGLQPEPMGSAEEMFERHAAQPWDLLVMDVALPGMSGLEACQRLRQRGDRVAIILVTSGTDDVDRIIGLEMGADDCLHKPFSSRELLARVRTVLRRLRSTAAAAVEAPNAVVEMGAWTFRPGSRSIHRGDTVRVLNGTDFALLSALTSAPHQAVERDLLLVAASGEQEILPRAVDASILRLRRLIEDDPAHPRYLQTVRFRGYMFVPDAARPAA